MNASTRKIIAVSIVALLSCVTVGMLLFVMILHTFKHAILTVEPASLDSSESAICEVFGVIHVERSVSGTGITYKAEIIVDRCRILSDCDSIWNNLHRHYAKLGWDAFEGDVDLVARLDGKRIRLVGIVFSPNKEVTYLRPPESDKPHPRFLFSSEGYICLTRSDGNAFVVPRGIH